MPIVGMVSDSLMRAATCAGTASSTIAKQPAASSASASSCSLIAASAVRPWARKPPSLVADCGVSPTCPITPMFESAIACARESIRPAPSSFTTSAPPSFTRRIAFATACSSDTSYEPNGMSPITSGRCAARVTARVRKIISSSVTGIVDSWPSITIAAVSPTRISSTPAWSASSAAGAS
jgi:hypothetical protein